MADVFGVGDGNGYTVRAWQVSQDEVGHRDYTAVLQVKALANEGPAAVLQASGLPVTGSIWQFDGDSDSYAFCKSAKECKQRIEQDGEGCTIWDVTLHFSSKPDLEKCETGPFDNPLTQCPKISGHSIRKTREGVTQVDNISPIVNSAYEQIRGPNNEWDYSHSGIKISMNVGDFDLVLEAQALVDYVNVDAMWGSDPRCVKLSNVTYEKKFYGAAMGTCNVYWTLILDFEIQAIDPATIGHIGVLGSPLGGWDRLVIDEATKVLCGHWNETNGQWQIDQISGIINPPSAPSLAPGLNYPLGSLSNGTYQYVFSAIDGSGKESAPSPVGTVVLSEGGGIGGINLSWPIIPGASSYLVYRNVAGTYKILAGVGGSTPNAVDNGVVSPGTRTPQTVSQSAVYPNPKNPSHFIDFKARKTQNPCKVILNGAGLPADVPYHFGPGTGSGTTNAPGHIPIQYYQEISFLGTLGVPADIAAVCVSWSGP